MSKSVLVTGGGKRIGRAIAEALGKDGWSVAIHYHSSRADAESIAEIIRSAGGKAAAVQADLMREAETSTLVERAESVVGPLEALINNAAVFERDTVESVTRDSWDLHIETNLRAPFVLMQSFARRLPEGAHGNIINLLDQRVWNLGPTFTSYTVSKMGLWALTQSLAVALAPRIRVNAVGPGPTLPSIRQTPEQFAAQCDRVPLRHGATPEDIANAVRYLLGARAVTGQMIAVDGGEHLGVVRKVGSEPPPE
ncbi:MAG TPA: SDR family oxidoreductase [Polyangium sp.]|jgi:NAD(P)-dependent dehydrogenase (short-subunit alcohol dehydrogenase family)|nr:SDR family oxidoreductase [Polyangium sp.]